MNDWHIYLGFLLILGLTWSYGFAIGHQRGWYKALESFRITRRNPIYFFRSSRLDHRALSNRADRFRL
jgi:hypothetical protein